MPIFNQNDLGSGSGLSAVEKAGIPTIPNDNLVPGAGPWQQGMSAEEARWAHQQAQPIVQEPLGEDRMIAEGPPAPAAIRYRPGYVQQPPQHLRPQEMEPWQYAMLQQQIRANAPPAEVLRLEGPEPMDGVEAARRKRAREELARQFQAGHLDQHFQEPHQQQLVLHDAAVNALHAGQAPEQNALAIHERQAKRHQLAAAVQPGIRPQVNAFNARARGAYDLNDEDRAQLAAMQAAEQRRRLFGGEEPVVVRPPQQIEAPAAPVAAPLQIEAPPPAAAVEAPLQIEGPPPAAHVVPRDRARNQSAAAAAVRKAVARPRRS
jgi:hypothetical protein